MKVISRPAAAAPRDFEAFDWDVIARPARQVTAESGVCPGCRCCSAVAWGNAWDWGSAAFWVEQTVQTQGLRQRQGDVGTADRHRIGRSLVEELAVCMLGGYGVPGPVGNAAFKVLVVAGLLSGAHLEETLRLPEAERPAAVERLAAQMSGVLSEPLQVPGRRPVRYRFHQQRPQRIAAALGQLIWWPDTATLGDRALRDKLTTLPGVGPKTASWTVRNHRGSDSVAIIDVHLRRAGISAGWFCSSWTLPGQYDRFESAFLAWADRGQVSAADLDACIWGLLASLGDRGRLLLQTPVPAGR